MSQNPPGPPDHDPSDVPPALLFVNDEQHLALADASRPAGTTTGSPPGAGAAHPHIVRRARFGEGYAWPAWSPDGRRALVSHARRSADGGALLDLVLVDTTSGRTAMEGASGGTTMEDASGEPPAPLFSNHPDYREPIAPGVMHYTYWAPDGSRVLVAARDEDGLGLSLLTPPPSIPPASTPPARTAPTPPPADPDAPDPDAADPAGARRLIGGAPLFTAWSPDSRTLAVHAGPQLVLIDTDTDAEPRRVLQDQPRFRAPAWSPDGSALYYAAPGAGSQDLLWRSRPDGGDRDIVAEVAGLTALLASPTTDQLALLTLDAGGLGGHDLRLLDPADGSQRIVERGQVGGAAWEPDGASLFYITRAGVETDFALTRYDVASAQHRGLAHFRPSPAFSAYLAFFDQYAQSHRLISADGRWFTLGGTISGNGGNPRRPFGPNYGCYVLPTDGSGPPRRLAAGEIGFFSPAAPSAS